MVNFLCLHFLSVQVLPNSEISTIKLNYSFISGQCKASCLLKMLSRQSKPFFYSARNISLSSRRFEKEPFIRGSVTSINALTIGECGHGKTLLTSNISKVASKDYKSVEDFDKGSSSGGSYRSTHVCFYC